AIAALFVLLAMLLSTLAVMLLGTAGGDNFRFNLGGVLAALLLTIALVRYQFWTQPWMAAAVYGWQLKRSLMSVTNVMHQVKAGVQTGNPAAMQLLRFYHLGLAQMLELDGNTSALTEAQHDSEQHKACMVALAMDTEQLQLDPEWLATVKQLNATK
ncbi:MAG: DUF3087 domain-containing protein, partial [Pseudomonadaceae bacterium]|nr:DUF3087 domain-containing protein [Pseudomonadaceae bacterium]